MSKLKASNYTSLNHYFVESNKYTFHTHQIFKRLCGLDLDNSLNLFSGESLLGDVRVDIQNPKATDIIDAEIYLRESNHLFDLIIIDPPFTGKLFEKYNLTEKSNYYKWFTEIKREAGKHLNVGGSIVIFGYSAEGMPANWGYENIELNVYTLGAMRASFFMSISKKIVSGQENFKWRLTK